MLMSDMKKIAGDLISLANSFDESGDYETANELTKVASSITNENIREAFNIFKPFWAQGRGNRSPQPQQAPQALSTSQDPTSLIQNASYQAAVKNDTKMQQQVQNLISIQQQYKNAIKELQVALYISKNPNSRVKLPAQQPAAPQQPAATTTPQQPIVPQQPAQPPVA